MQDFNLISRQLRREVEQGERARRKLTENTRKAEENKYASSTKYGQQTLKGLTTELAKSMKNSMMGLARGRGCVDGATVYKHLKGADAETLSVLALKVCLDVLGQESKPKLTDLTIPIGAAIEIELKLRWYQSQDKDLFNRIDKSFHSSTGTSQKHTVFRLRFNEAGLEWSKWGQITLHKIGAWCLKALMEQGLITQEKHFTGKTKSTTIMRFSNEYLGMRDSIMARAMELAFCLWPMLCPPNEWDNDQSGGYLTEEIRKSGPMIRKAGFEGGPKQGKTPIMFLNNLQRQVYKLNPEILKMAQWCYEHRREVGKFRISDPIPNQEPFVGDPIAEPERFKLWKREEKKINDFNAQLFQYNFRTTETMFVAEMYKDEQAWWIPWSYDYRGRVYPQNTTLNPQGTDFDKSLLLFNEEGPVDEYWLAWHVATTYGHDKLSHDDRVQWTRDNVELISRIAQDPISTITDWENLDDQGNPNGEPWCFLAAAIDYHETCIAKTRTTSGLPIGIDATCSGLQHLSSMTRDAKAGKEVNVIRGDKNKPSDGYKTVAEAACKYLEDVPEVIPFMNRSITKRTVMTTPYGVSRDSARDYIKKALKKAGFDLSVPGRLGKIVDAIYRKAVPEVFEGPVNVMNWLQAKSIELLQNGHEEITWTTPTGFVVVQDLRKSLATLVKTKLMGSVQCYVGNGWGDPNLDDHKGAIAPNFVHSLDASLLQATFRKYDKPFTVIHDCVLARSCDVGRLGKRIRRMHQWLYETKPLEAWAREQGMTEDDLFVLDADGNKVPLIKDTMNLKDVNDSPYYFC